MGSNLLFTISLENVRLFGHHGIYEHETRDGNEFQVDLSVTYPGGGDETANTDSLEYSISYVRLFEIVREEIESTKKLLETVAYKIVTAIRKFFPSVISIQCKITKLHPPISSFQGNASVSINWSK